jgi:hypothetical protein
LVPGALIKGPKFKAPGRIALLSLTIIAVGRHNFWEAAAFPSRQCRSKSASKVNSANFGAGALSISVIAVRAVLFDCARHIKRAEHMSAQHQQGLFCVWEEQKLAAPGRGALSAIALLPFVLGIANLICRLFTLSQRFDEDAIKLNPFDLLSLASLVSCRAHLSLLHPLNPLSRRSLRSRKSSWLGRRGTARRRRRSRFRGNL